VHYDGHHAAVFVIKDVAVVDRPAGEVFEGDAERDVAAGGDVYDVPPGGFCDRLTGAGDDLHRPDVQVHGVVHRADVGDGPFLDGAGGNNLVGAVRVELFAVDGEAHPGAHS
jgi:hypothetical protein